MDEQNETIKEALGNIIGTDVVFIPGVKLRPKMKLGRNSKCLCGSGKKFKNCCLPTQKDLANNMAVRQ